VALPAASIDDAGRGRALGRLRLFADTYGLTEAERDDLVPAVRQNHEWSYDIVGTAAANGHAGFSDYLAGGAMERAQRTHEWYAENADLLRAALA
jgi:hypothetical protein